MEREPCFQNKQLAVFKVIGHLADVRRRNKQNTEEWPPGDVKPGQEEGYAAWLTSLANYDTYKTELEYCCHYDLAVRLDILCLHLDQHGLRLKDIPLSGERSCLITATSNRNVNASMVLIKYADRSLLMNGTWGKGYVGVTALHCTVVNQMTDVIKEILDSLNIEDQLSLIHHHVEGERVIYRLGLSSLVLNLSCYVCNIEIFDELLSRGAELDKKDMLGYNIIHTLVEISTERTEEAKTMLAKVFKSLAARQWYCRRFDVEERYWTTQEDVNLKKLLLNMENKDGYTPLTLAAKLGATEILDNIINSEGVYRNTLLQFGLIYIVKYDVTEINPRISRQGHLERANVMNLLIYRGINFQVLEAFSIPVIKRLVSMRWKWYRFPYFIWATWHVITMILCFYVPVTYIKGKDAFLYPHANRTLPENTTLLPISRGILDLSHMSPGSHEVKIFPIVVVILLLYLIINALAELSDIIRSTIGFILHCTRRWHHRYYNAPLLVIAKWDIFRFSLLGFLVTEIAVLWEVFVNAKMPYEMTAVSLIGGWYFVLFFLQGFRSTGYFSFIMHRILFSDMLSFGSVFTIVLLAFGSSMMFLVNRDDIDNSNIGYQTIWDSFYTMTKMMSGFAGEPVVSGEVRQTMMHITFMIFVTMTILLLLNMLIAAMSETYSNLAQHQEQLWIRSRAAAMLLIERRFLQCFSVFMNKCTLMHDKDTKRWYFEIETKVPPT